MKQTKRIISLLLSVVLALSVMCVPASAVGINDSNVFLKQAKGSKTCTLVSVTMMLRRHAILDGSSTWSDITESAVKPTAWVTGQGLSNGFPYRGMNVKCTYLADSGYTTTAKKKAYFISMLTSHPEGIVIYNYSHPHAVLLTDYDSSKDTFYCADPAYEAPSGRIKLVNCVIPGKTQNDMIGNIDKIWYIASGSDNKGTGTLSTEKILTMSYNVNGGTLNSTEYKATSAGIVQKDGANVTRKWAYGTGDTKNGLINATTFGLTRSGYTFVGWSLSKDGTSTIFGQDDTTLKAETIYPNIKNGSASVTLYAVWQPAEKILTMLYNVNGGTLNSTEYKATSAGIVQKDGANVTRKWAYGTGDTKNGLINATTFGLTRSGYKFVGWSASKYDTSIIFDQDDTTLKAETIYPNIKNGSASIILYAVWKPEEVNPCAKGHTWNRGVITREPTTTSTGVRTYTCTVCGETKTETIPAVSAASGLDNFVEKTYYYNGQFRDVSASDWFGGNVAMSYRLGLMKGTGDSVFSPGKNLSIAETIAIAARLHSIYHTGGENYTTYDGGTWYDPYVDYARKNGIISGSYNYSQTATRELFAHILAQALPSEALDPIKNAISFADSGRITYRSDIELLTRAGIIAGIEKGGNLYFQPSNTITRAEVAAIVTRMAKTDLRVY